MGDVTGDDQVYTDLWLEEDENDRKVPLLTFEEVQMIRYDTNVIDLSMFGVE